jgi:hypothetical protein
MEDLSDASFLGKAVVLPANVRLDWKGIGRYKHSTYLASSSAMKKKSLTVATEPNVASVFMLT